MKKILIILFLLVSLWCPKALALVEPTGSFYVNDYANVLSRDTQEYILEKSVFLANKTKAQIVVVTVNNLEGRDIESYATELFRKFGIGDKDENNGLLLLLALEERQFRVEVGYGLEGILPDGLTGRYQDEYIIPYLKEDKWDEGIKSGYDAFYEKIDDYYANSSVVSQPKKKGFDYYSAFCLAFCLIAGVMLGSIGSKENSKMIKLLYIIMVSNLIALLIAFFYNTTTFVISFIVEVVFYFMCSSDYRGSGRSGVSHGSFHRSSHSSSHSSYHGGGGLSGGGGSSRRF